jgi:uncharacterized protein
MRSDVEIRAATVLPARREPIELHTGDGLKLVGELALPEVRPPAANRLPALADLAVLRFNTRGTSSDRGTSEGAFDGGEGERFDVAAALEYAEFHDLPRVWVIGWSFGSELALKWAQDPLVEGAILLSPPLHRATDADLDAWAAFGRPLTALVPEFDDYLRPTEARERFAAVPQAEVVGVPGAKHLWVGDAETVLDEIVRRVNPAVEVPLPTTWDGPMEAGDVSAYADRTVAAFADTPVPGPAAGQAG